MGAWPYDWLVRRAPDPPPHSLPHVVFEHTCHSFLLAHHPCPHRHPQNLPQRPDKILRRLNRPESMMISSAWGAGRAEGWGTHVNDAGDCYQV